MNEQADRGTLQSRPVEAVLLDWAGTTMDYGCMAPAVVFVEVFERQGVPITMEEARAPMGAHKRVHIQQIAAIPAVRERWQNRHGRPPEEGDVDAMFTEFVPRQLGCLARYAELIPGTLQVVAELRSRGIRIGSTSGYLTEMMEINQAEAHRQGYQPDVSICASDVPAGRPHPHMCLRNAIELEVSSVARCVKIDDTVPGIAEGLNAGMWTIGLAISGNEVGLPLDKWEALAPSEKAARRTRAYRRMASSGAHFVVDTIADVMPCIDEIEARIRRGQAPSARLERSSDKVQPRDSGPARSWPLVPAAL